MPITEVEGIQIVRLAIRAPQKSDVIALILGRDTALARFRVARWTCKTSPLLIAKQLVVVRSAVMANKCHSSMCERHGSRGRRERSSTSKPTTRRLVVHPIVICLRRGIRVPIAAGTSEMKRPHVDRSIVILPFACVEQVETQPNRETAIDNATRHRCQARSRLASRECGSVEVAATH